MKTYEKNGNLYELRQVDPKTIVRVLIGKAEQHTQPHPTQSVSVPKQSNEIEVVKLKVEDSEKSISVLESLSQLPVSKLKKELKDLSSEDKVELMLLEQAKAEPRKSVIELLS